MGETPVSDLSNLLAPRTYPEAFALVRDSFARQPDLQTCGAAVVRHGLLLGGLLARSICWRVCWKFATTRGWTTRLCERDWNPLVLMLNTERSRKKQSTAAFLEGLRLELEQGAFLLPCLNGGTHWVCLGAWDGKRAWVVDSYHGKDWYWTPRGLPPSLGFFGYTEQEFDKQDWEDCINVVRPGKWTKQYQDWLPARRRPAADDGAGRPDRPGER